MRAISSDEVTHVSSTWSSFRSDNETEAGWFQAQRRSLNKSGIVRYLTPKPKPLCKYEVDLVGNSYV